MSRAAIIMNSLAAVLLLAAFVWGGAIYPRLPEALPTHWNAAGEADAFSDKSLWSVFGTLLIGTATFLLLTAIQLFMNRRESLVPAEKEAISLGMSYLNIGTAVLFVWVALLSWYGSAPGPLFMTFVLLLALPVLVIMGIYLPRITKQRRESADPAEPAFNPRYWVLGGIFYNNPEDPRTIVPRPPHMGFGGTFNLATSGGKILVAVLIVVLIGTLSLPFFV